LRYPGRVVAVAVIVGVVILFVIVKAMTTSAGASMSTSAGRAQRGTPARGILLWVATTPSGSVGITPWKCQLRTVVMDIEIPGQPPYEATVTVRIPTNLVRDVLPGATVELRVNPKRPSDIAIVGPGVGFNSALLNSTTSQGS